MENLKETIVRLHDALAKTDNVDPELKSLLEILDKDIQLALARQEAADKNAMSLQDRARMMAAEFAGEHPVLEPTLREIADRLGKMGI